MLSVEERLQISELKRGGSIVIDSTTVKKDTRGRWILSSANGTKTFDPDVERQLIYDKIDELNEGERKSTIGEPFKLDDTDLIAIKTNRGYEVYDSKNRLVQKVETKEDLIAYVKYYKGAEDRKKVEKTKKKFQQEVALSNRKRVLYYFILVLSTILLTLTFGLGIKFDGVAINRVNNDLYITIKDIAEAKYPEKRMDKFDAVYYTLNYHAQNDNYYMLPKTIVEVTTTVVEGEEPVEVETTRTLPVIQSSLYHQYVNTTLPDGSKLSMNLKDDDTYSGVDFNNLFKTTDGKYIPKEMIINRMGYILGYDNIHTMEELINAYLVWDQNEVKSNRAYNWEVIKADGMPTIDGRADYYRNYLDRNSFIKIFLNDSSKFVHEYLLFGSIGWLTISSFVVLILYIILAFALWVFTTNGIKTSKLMIKTIIILTAVVMIPLLLQFVFEGLSKEANELLSVIENSTYTTTTTLMNFIFDYIIKFGNLLLTGVLTIGLPLKVIRHFVHNKLRRVESKIKVAKTLNTDGSVIDALIKETSHRM